MKTDVEKRQQALGQFRLAVGESLAPFHMYGMDIYVAPAIKHIVQLALQLHARLNGQDVVIGGTTQRED